MYVDDRDTYNDVFCQDCGHIAEKSTLTAGGLCEDCTPPLLNFAHMAYHANIFLERLGMETLTVNFWQGLWEGRGDISVNPDDLLPG